MKRLTITLLTLLMSMGAWAEDEFPIELTCEVGMLITYLHLEKTAKESWFMFHESSDNFDGSALAKRHRKFITEKGVIRKIEYDWNKSLYVELKWPVLGFRIQKYNLKLTTLGGSGLLTPGYVTGQCYKGFKEYEKQI
tara:strand:+ start:383 stop:796 length:414 start_codon:yes stop_codon:yes gene_type:complete